MTRPVETSKRWTCPRCHDHWQSAMPMPSPYHLCERSGRVESFVLAWSPERAAEVEQPNVRRLRLAA